MEVKRGRFLRTFATAFFVLCLTVPAFGQLGQGVVTGTVTDPSGAVVPGATLALLNEGTGVRRIAQSNEVGIYTFQFTDVGSYTLSVSAQGFAGYEVKGLVVTVGQTVTNNAKLELSRTAQTVTVESGGVQQVNTANAEVSTLINSTTIANLPLEVRDTTVFVNLVPGSVPNDFNGSTRGASINGMRGGTGNFMVDGSDNNDYGQGGRTKNTMGSVPGGLVSVSPEAVEEFSVVTNNFSAEYGRSGGFVTDLVVKSGTNALHGSAFEYNRNSATTANDFFTNKAGGSDQLIRNQFGGSLGGPIKKDKMFIFGAAEFQRVRQTTPFTTTGLTQQFVDFTDSGGLASFLNANAFNAITGAPVSINCANPSNPGCTLGPIFKQLDGSFPLPRATTGLSNVSGSPFLVSSTGSPLVYPVPIFGFVTYPQKTIFNEDRLDFRYDYSVSSKDTLTADYLYDNYPTTTTGNGGDFANPAFGSVVPARAQNAGMGWTHILSPTVVNEAKVSYLRSYANFPAFDPQVPSIGTIDPLGEGFGTTSALPQKNVNNTFQYQDSLSVIRGNHTFKLGGEYRRIRNGSNFAADSDGLYEFWDTEDLLTDGAIGDLGGIGGFYASEASINPSSPTPALPNFYRGYRDNEFGFYGEDNIKASRRVTLTLGLRYDYFGVPHNYKPGIDSNFYFGSPVPNQCITRNSTSATVCYPGDTTAGAPLLSNNPYFPINGYTAALFSAQFQVRNHEIWNKDTNNFAPRVGVAWDVFGNHKTVIRTGGGIFYDRMYDNIFENMRFNPPFFAFSQKGLFINGTTQGPVSTPGFYSVPINVANFAGAGATPSPRQMDQNLVAAYSEGVNFDVQHQFGGNWLFDTSYVGTFGHKLLGLVNINTFDGRTIGGQFSSVNIQPNISTDNMRGNWWNSNYNSLQVKLSKRFSHGLQFETNYTYSHALDYVSDVFNGRYNAGEPEDSYNRQLEYGAADFDLRHRLVAYGVWDLPVFRNNKWLGGWSFDGNFSIQSGSPFTIFDSATDTNSDGVFGDRAAYLGTGSPMSTVTHSMSPADGYIEKASMFGPTPVPTGGIADGLLARNVMTGPKFVGTDLSISKKFEVTERIGLKVIVSGFNVFNHPNFALPVGDVNNTAQFGQSIATIQPNNTGTGARVMQFAARLDF
ncbi:MAG TPA: TonB-dependent receptor [Bryobacteraceae bacterium]